MKRFLLSFLALSTVAAATAQCDPTDHDFMGAAFGVSPDPNVGENFEPAVLNVAYNEVVYVKVPTTAADIDETYPNTVLIDSLRLEAIYYLDGDSYFDISNLGLSVECNNNGESPDDCMFFPGGQYCGDISGIPNQAGVFSTKIDVTIYILAFGIPTSIPYSFENYTLEILSVIDIEEAPVASLSLNQSVPNPASVFTDISFELGTNEEVELIVSNLVGKRVFQKKISSKRGSNSYRLDVSTFESGIYLYSIQSGDRKYTRRMMVQK